MEGIPGSRQGHTEAGPSQRPLHPRTNNGCCVESWFPGPAVMGGGKAGPRPKSAAGLKGRERHSDGHLLPIPGRAHEGGKHQDEERQLIETSPLVT